MADQVSDLSLSDLVTGKRPGTQAPAPVPDAAPAKIKMSQIRQQFPMYADLPDEQLLSGLHKKFYADIPMSQMVNRVDFDTTRDRLQKQNLDEMGWGGQFLAGAGRSAAQLGRTVRRLNPFDSYSQKDAADDAAIDKPLTDSSGGFWGGLAGDIATTAVPGGAMARGAQVASRALPKALQVAGNIGGAAASGAATGAALTPEDFGKGATAGAIGGAAGDAAGRVLTKTLGGVFANKVTPEARQLMDQGINVPAWKAADSPGFRNLAERAKGLPVVGPLMKSQEGRAMEDYNRVLVKDATPPTPVLDDANGVLRWADDKPVSTVGQSGMADLRQRFKDAYGAIYEGRTIPLDEQLVKDFGEIGGAAERYMPGAAPDVHGVMRRVSDTLRAGMEETPAVKSAILDAAGQPIETAAAAPGHAGATNGAVQRALDIADDAIQSAWRAGDAEKARVLEHVRDAVQGVRQRGLPPEVQSMLEPVNAAYANFKLLQRASGSLGAVRQEGIVTPLQMTNAVKANDRSASKVATTEGRALGQQDAQRAQRVLGSELPEVGPGTAEKMGLMGLMASGGWVAPTTTALTAAAMSRPGQRALMGGYGWQEIARKHPEVLADYLRSMGAGIGAANAQ